jgi:hypothetical protein
MKSPGAAAHRLAMIPAAMLTAVFSGVRAPGSSPTGDDSRSSSWSVTPYRQQPPKLVKTIIIHTADSTLDITRNSAMTKAPRRHRRSHSLGAVALVRVPIVVIVVVDIEWEPQPVNRPPFARHVPPSVSLNGRMITVGAFQSKVTDSKPRDTGRGSSGHRNRHRGHHAPQAPQQYRHRRQLQTRTCIPLLLSTETRSCREAAGTSR